MDIQWTDIPWPSEGDTLFQDSFEIRNVARINGFSKDLCAYAIGYRDAAKMIVDHLDSTPKYPDLLIYPVVFLYRQAIELLLKELITISDRQSGKRVCIKLKHDLPKLWKVARSFIEKYSDGNHAELLDNTENLINQLDQIDPLSTAFRYPIDTKENESIIGVHRIDIQHLSEKMEGLYNALSASVDWLDDLIRSSDY